MGWRSAEVTWLRSAGQPRYDIRHTRRTKGDRALRAWAQGGRVEGVREIGKHTVKCQF